MGHLTAVFALALSGFVAASAGTYAAQASHSPSAIREAALVGPPPGVGSVDSQRDVIEPPSSVDPGMAFDPPQTGAKMPILHPPTSAPDGRPILPR